MKRFCCIFLSLLFLAILPVSAQPGGQTDTVLPFPGAIRAKSVLLMEASTGRILFEQHADDPLPPASVTKVMTMLLVLEAVDSGKMALTDEVTVSEYAASMGGSQVFLKAGEVMTAEDLLKSVAVASANDAAVALAEYLCGSETAFVSLMNERAAALGMEHTVFRNTNGLDDTDTGHVTSARDIALMSRELLSHPAVFDYTTIWMDTIRNGAFTLTNTNRLVRFYRGCNGLKTGSTAKAGFCISAAAERDGMQLICVIMGAPDKNTRNSLAAELLDWGFASYMLASVPPEPPETLRVLKGQKDFCTVEIPGFSAVLPKGSAPIRAETSLPETLSAPVTAGSSVGKVTFRSGETILGSLPVTVCETIPELTWIRLFSRLLHTFLLADPNVPRRLTENLQ